MSTETNPWSDFFNVYVELALALRGELPQDSPTLTQLDAFLNKVKQGTSEDQEHKAIVHEVIARFRGKSKAILLQEPEYFNESLLLFPGIDSLDIAQLWIKHPLYRNGLWAWIEQIYIIGNVCLHPNRKDKFLQIVRQIKASKPGSTISAEAPESDEPENIGEVVDGIANMMGVGDNPVMKEMFGEVAQHMQSIMTSNANPMELIQAMLNGDTSMLGGLEQRMQAKMAQKIQSGELTEADLARQREGMLQNFGGMNGIMQMASGLGLNVGTLNAAAAEAGASIPPTNEIVQPAKKTASRTPTTGGPKPSARKPKKQ